MSAVAAPRFSILTPVYDPPIGVLQDTLASIRAQTYSNWELILVDDGSPNPHVAETLNMAQADDKRIQVAFRDQNGGIVAASNDALALARGEFVVLVDHDDLLPEYALEWVDAAIREHPKVDYLYSDEDKIDNEGEHFDEFRKPDWSPERLRGHMYAGHLSVLRTELVREVGGFRAGFEGSQDHDLVLRVTERARSVVHIPAVLYHWRTVPGSAATDPDSKPYAWLAGRVAVQEHLDRLGIQAEAELGPVTSFYSINRTARIDDLVSVVVPTRGSGGIVWGERKVFIEGLVEGLVKNTVGVEYEIVVVYDRSTSAKVLDRLRELAGERLVLVEYDQPFNFSQKCNLGVLASKGRWIALLNDDLDLVSPNFLQSLVAPLLEEGVGLTGGNLRYANTGTQHAGVVVNRTALAHAYAGALIGDPGLYGDLIVNRECSALTAACVAISREVFFEVGGLSEQLPVNFNDVDLCFKLRRAGYRLIWLVNTRAYHFESATRPHTMEPWEHQFFLTRWVVPEVDEYLPMAPFS